MNNGSSNLSLIRNVTDFAPIFENRFMDSLLWAWKTLETFLIPRVEMNAIYRLFLETFN